MSKSLNKVTLIGNLGADPDVRSTPNGARVATLSVATSRVWKDAAGVKQEKTQWHKVICWDGKAGPKLAEVAERFLHKGDKVYVEGEIEYRQYQDKEGQTKYITEIVCRELILLGGKGVTESGPGKREPVKASRDPSFKDFPDALDGDDDIPF